MRTFLHISLCACYIYIHSIFQYTSVFMYTCMHAYLHTHTHTYIHTHIHTCMHTYIHTYLPTCIHSMYIYIYIHTYTYIQSGQLVYLLASSFFLYFSRFCTSLSVRREVQSLRSQDATAPGGQLAVVSRFSNLLTALLCFKKDFSRGWQPLRLNCLGGPQGVWKA